jgi:phosphoglycolate phosphatase-like HAD superfamily hydrolase
LESQEREASTGRSRNVVHILPQSTDSVPRFLTGPLERIDPVAGGTQVVVVTEDPESAVALAEAVLAMTGMAGIELFPVTSPRRAARIMQGRPVLAIAGSAPDLVELIRASNLKLDQVHTIVLAWADDIFEPNSPAGAAVEMVMTEIPKDAARVVVTSNADARVDSFVERYLRRARKVDEREPSDETAPISLQYMTVSPTNRVAALRRLLDDLDPPSAAIVAASGDAERSASNLLRALGYSGEGNVRLSSGDIPPNTHAVIFFGMPASRAVLAAAQAANPVATVAMVQPREVAQLRRLAGGEVKPLTLSSAGRSAREREDALRRELNTVLESGLPAREILALEPLLENHDGIEIAAAALRLLERERSARKTIEAAAAQAAAVPKREPPARMGYDRPPRSMDSDSRPPRSGGRPPQDRGGRPPRNGGGRPPRDGGRRPPTDRGGRPPRGR